MEGRWQREDGGGWGGVGGGVEREKTREKGKSEQRPTATYRSPFTRPSQYVKCAQRAFYKPITLTIYVYVVGRGPYRTQVARRTNCTAGIQRRPLSSDCFRMAPFFVASPLHSPLSAFESDNHKVLTTLNFLHLPFDTPRIRFSDSCESL